MRDHCSGFGFVPLLWPHNTRENLPQPAGRTAGLLPFFGRKAEMPHVKGKVVPSSMRSNMLRDHISEMKISRSASASRAICEECAVVPPQAEAVKSQ